MSYEKQELNPVETTHLTPTMPRIYKSELFYAEASDSTVPNEPDDIDTVEEALETNEKQPDRKFSAQNLSILSEKAWVIQVASFSDKKNADFLVEKLRSYNYHAFSQVVEQEGEILHRVYVGPDFSQGKIFSLASKLRDELKLSSIVINYTPS